MAATKKISLEDFDQDPVLSERASRGIEVARALDAKAPRLPYSRPSLVDGVPIEVASELAGHASIVLSHANNHANVPSNG